MHHVWRRCGRTTHVTDGFGLSNRQVTSTPKRCPRGTPLRSLGKALTPRPLVAGCMISADARYDPEAEVHLPDACDVPADHLVGCLDPSALNYASGALQVHLP